MLQKDGKHISWCHLQDLYDKDLARPSGLKLLPKVKKEHVKLNSYSRMRVDLAAQVSVIHSLVQPI